MSAAPLAVIKGVVSAITGGAVEMPEYRVTSPPPPPGIEQGVEEREYPETMWVSTTIQGMKYSDSTSTGFWKLFNYIQGQNEASRKIDMTAPVRVKVVPGAGPNCESTFTISFYLGKEHWERPPKPTDNSIFIEKCERTCVYVRTFSGFAKEEDWISQAALLSKSLSQDNTYRQDFYFTAGYDSPFKLFNRRNEVWFAKGGAAPNPNYPQ